MTPVSSTGGPAPVERDFCAGSIGRLLSLVSDVGARTAALDGAIEVVVAEDRAGAELAAEAIFTRADARRERAWAEKRGANPGALGGLVRYAEAEDIDLAERMFLSENGVSGDYGRMFGECAPKKAPGDWAYGSLIVEHRDSSRRRPFRFSQSCLIAVLRVERLGVLLTAAVAAEEARLAAYRAVVAAVTRERAERDARRDAEPIAALLARIKSDYLYKMMAFRNCDYFPLVDGEFVFGQGVSCKGASTSQECADASALAARATEADVEAIAAMHERAVEIHAPERAERAEYIAVMNARDAELDPTAKPMAAQDTPRLVVIHKAGVHWLTVDRVVGDERAVVYDVDCVRKAARRCVDINYPLRSRNRPNRQNDNMRVLSTPIADLVARVPGDMIGIVMRDAMEVLPLLINYDVHSDDVDTLSSHVSLTWIDDRAPWGAAMRADAAEVLCLYRGLRCGDENNVAKHCIPRVVIIHKCGAHMASSASSVGSLEAEVFDIDVLRRLLEAAARA